MQTKLAERWLNSPKGKEADKILRSCVHCGFCTATCPTYQLLGDELDGPRGRIYEIKLALEGQPISKQTRLHLDRCLTCLNCETTCPSGVQYHRLLDIGREYVESQVPRSLKERFIRRALRAMLPYTNRIAPFITIGRWLKPLLPASLGKKIPPKQKPLPAVTGRHTRKVLMLSGCVQSTMTPRTNQAAKTVLNRLGIEAIEAPGAGCCGALSHHLNATEEAKTFMRRNIDAWWPYIEQGVEAVVMTASGCGVMIKDYGVHLRDDPAYGEKAQHISRLSRDLCEVISVEDIEALAPHSQTAIAFHPPCTLQHGQKLQGCVETLLQAAGFHLTPVNDSHLCCGSAGTYSILQPKLADALKQQKLQHLQAHEPEFIVTANIGCQLHLQTDAAVPVIHWVELFAS